MAAAEKIRIGRDWRGWRDDHGRGSNDPIGVRICILRPRGCRQPGKCCDKSGGGDTA